MGHEQESTRGLATLQILMTSGLAVLAMVLMNAILTNSASAEPPEIVFEVSPQEVKLPSKDGTIAIAVLRNHSDADSLRNVRLTILPDAGVKAVPEEPAELGELSPGADHAWTLRITPTGEGPISGTVRLRVDYDWVAASQTNAGETRIVSQTKVTSLTIIDRTPATLDEVAKAEIQSGFGSLGPVSLSHERPGTIYLSISNVSKLPIIVTGVNPKRPENIISFDCERSEFVRKSCKLRSDNGISIEPQEKVIIPIEVNPTERVTPGRYVLLFEIPIMWGWPGTEQKADLLARQEISVEVFGESQIIGALGLPAGIVTILLILPGFLILGMWTLLWRFIPLKGEAKSENSFPVGKTDLAFYIIALTISVAFVVAYFLFTERIYLQSYGVRDILAIWFISLILGCVVYLVVWIPVILYKRLLTPARDPIRYLRQLKWQERIERRKPSVWLNRAKVEWEGKSYEVFRLKPHAKNQEEVWIGPSIVVNWTRKDNELSKQIEQHLKRPGHPGLLAKALKKGANQKSLEVEWESAAWPFEPHAVGKDKIKDWIIGPDSIVKVR